MVVEESKNKGFQGNDEKYQNRLWFPLETLYATSIRSF